MSNNSDMQEFNTENTLPEQDSGEEFSTVFSDPTEHRKKAENSKRKKLLPKIIAAALSLAILAGGTVAVIKLIPEREEETPPVSGLGDITVLEMNSDEFKTVTVTNTNGTFKLYSEEQESEETEESDTTSSSTKVVNWYLEGYDKELLSTYSTSAPASTLSQITASREITEKTAADCGLDNPVIRADVVSNDDAEFSVLIGSDSPDNSGCYLKLSTSDKIYLVESSVKSSLEFNALYFANSDSMPAFTLTDDMADYKGEDGALATFDSITVTGKNFPEKVVIVPNNDELLSDLAAFVVTSPMKRIADNVDSLYTLFKTGLAVTGAYSFDTSAASVKAVGLDNPDFVTTISVKGSTLTYKFKLQEDGSYAAVCDGIKLIKKVSADNLAFIDYSAKDFYSSWVCINNIDDLKSFTIKTPDKTYDFGIAANTDEDSDIKYIITYNGKTLDTPQFQSFYQQCISLSCSDFTIDDLSGSAEYNITFTFKDEIGGKNVIDFVKSSETKYQFYSDGVAGGKVASSSLKKLARLAEELVAK